MKWITVSRKMGTHGSDIAKRVASELGYRFYDTEAISQMAQELGVLDSVREIDEKRALSVSADLFPTTHRLPRTSSPRSSMSWPNRAMRSSSAGGATSSSGTSRAPCTSG